MIMDNNIKKKSLYFIFLFLLIISILFIIASFNLLKTNTLYGSY